MAQPTEHKSTKKHREKREKDKDDPLHHHHHHQDVSSTSSSSSSTKSAKKSNPTSNLYGAPEKSSGGVVSASSNSLSSSTSSKENSYSNNNAVVSSSSSSSHHSISSNTTSGGSSRMHLAPSSSSQHGNALTDADREDAEKRRVKEISARLGTTHLRDFEKIRIIGRGGVGRVWLVQLKGTDQLFAMKVMGKQEMIARKKVKRALTEREILSTADHPFIVTLYYSFQSKTKLVFVMQYCAGGEFYRFIQQQPEKRLTEEQTKFYAAEVLLALEYLHVMGFIYRDLKPENILMHESGHIMLTDFDLSKGASNPVTPRVVTKPYSRTPGVAAEPDLVTNSFVGTEEYLAPEVIKGTGHNATVDWWTFGILMFEMLYGTTPFRGNTRDVTFSNINSKSIHFPPQKRGEISKECKNLLKSLLHREPKKRLGAVGGATDIKDHPFFKGVKWQLMRNETPPIIPGLKGAKDLSYFPPIDEREDDWFDEDDIDANTLMEGDPFKEFETLDRTARVVQDRTEANLSSHPQIRVKKLDH